MGQKHSKPPKELMYLHRSIEEFKNILEEDSGAGQLSIPRLVETIDKNGLYDLPKAQLERAIQPILRGLAAIDAESLLKLHRSSIGPILRDDIRVAPIHHLITPPSDPQAVRYLHLAQIDNQYTMGIFVFPPGAKIPLHDHPGMCVLSRVLYGSLLRTSLDLTEPLTHKQQRAYKNPVDELVAPGVTVLYPFEGNLHEFVAGPLGAAVLDVLLPPYNGDRDCTYYDIEDIHEFRGNQQRCWIIPKVYGPDIKCISGKYRDLGDE